MSVTRTTVVVQEDGEYIDCDKNRLSIQVGKHVYTFYFQQTESNRIELNKLAKWIDDAVNFR